MHKPDLRHRQLLKGLVLQCLHCSMQACTTLLANPSMVGQPILLILVNPLPARQQGTGKGVVVNPETHSLLANSTKTAMPFMV